MTETPPPPDPTPSGDPLVGTVLAGRYRILRALGEGAMGSVYLGEHLRFGRHDAIKVLRREMARDTEATDRFLRGARNVSAINHPNVCTVYDFGDTEDGRQFLAMEFVEGETLAETVERERRLPLERTLGIVEQIARALDAAHEAGIVHRDLKPGNVMVTPGRTGGDRVKVVDFDIAKGSSEGAGAEVTRTGFVVGTPEYMSPEQLIGDPIDGRSDVYSLAVVFVRVLTGALPVRATSTQDMMVERLTREPLTLAEIAPELELPPGLQGALDRGLARRREDRPDSAGAFAASLRRAAGGGGPTEAAIPPVPAPGERQGPPAIPPTTVGAPPSTGEVRAARAGNGDGGRTLLPWAAAGGAVLVAAIGGILLFGGGGNGDATGPTLPRSAVTGDDPPPPPPDPGTAAADPPGADTGAASASETGRDETTAAPDANLRRADPTPPPAAPRTGERQAPEPGETPAAMPTRDEIEESLVELLLALDDDSPGRLAATRDSALALYGRDPAIPDDLRSTAAYVAAETFQKEGRLDEALTWVRRAVGLDPGNRGARGLLEQLGGAP